MTRAVCRRQDRFPLRETHAPTIRHESMDSLNKPLPHKRPAPDELTPSACGQPMEADGRGGAEIPPVDGSSRT